MIFPFLDGLAVAPSGMDPLFKWAGGKRRLVSAILPLVHGGDTYYEPFAGGAAIALALAPERAVLGDVNSELTWFYSCVKDFPETLLDRFREHERQNSQEHYYAVRGQVPRSNVDSAARFLYLNRAGFNGLYRQNSKGEFNVPYGGDRKDLGLDEANFYRVSRWLSQQDVGIWTGRFEDAIHSAREGDVVYLDPPYYPLKKESFVKYHQDVEDSPDVLLQRVKTAVEDLRRRGVRCVVSNANAPAVREAFPEAEGYHVQVLQHAWVVGSKGGSRAPQDVELLIHT